MVENNTSYKLCEICHNITPYVEGTAICDECKKGNVRPPPNVVVLNK